MHSIKNNLQRAKQGAAERQGQREEMLEDIAVALQEWSLATQHVAEGARVY